MVDFRIEPVEYLIQSGLLPLAQEQWEEEEPDKDVVKNDPNWEEIMSMQDNNRLRFFVMRDGEILAGYAMVIMIPSLLSKSTIYAFIQDLYVSRDYRKGMTAIRFYKYIEGALSHLKPSIIIAGERPHMFEKEEGLAKFYTRMGYKLKEKIWTKTLTQGNA